MNYQKLPGLSLDGRLYWNTEMGTLESIIPPGPYATAHAPTLFETEKGDLLCAWFAGSYEGAADISIICARLPKQAAKWEEPLKVSTDMERSEQNPSFFQAPHGEIWLMYTAQLARKPGKDNMQFTSVIRRQISKDDGKTWSEPDTMFSQEGSFCRQAIQVLSNGRWIFGNWLCTDSELGLAGDPSVFQLSDDQGKTWRMAEMPKSNGRVHPNVVDLGNGHLAAFMRSRFADYIYRSESRDWGNTWSIPAPTPLPNNNASISAIRLKSGRIAIAYNASSAANPVIGKASWPGLRCPVAVALSEDGGLTFPIIRWMERGEGFMGEENRTNNAQQEYPTIMQDREGFLHLVYAHKNRIGIKYMRFREEDVLGEKREREGLFNPTAAKFS